METERTPSITRAILLAALVPLLSGCLSGRIFEYTVRPLDLNMNNTPIMTRDAMGKEFVKHVHIPVPGYVPIDILWSSRAIGDVARRHGFTEIYYADLATFNVLTFWQTRTVHVYGR